MSFSLLSGNIFTLTARQLQVEEPGFSGVILLIRNDQLGEALESDSDKNRRFITTGTVNFNKTTAADIDFIPFTASKYLESFIYWK
ncbi:hypothetical protein [Cyclobacterium jeungdonense]|uniref:Uncharacterized protein n=1 Tax=Cyclobacterium jeungdonense TaxID=708087 RepID=A0ABT8C843_9BACT|nr:hypothetical protein [Cyclobacterium jeungdonense]MDN3688958.1 hypothetical protein [Cyclobacterium jeungdonense]